MTTRAIRAHAHTEIPRVVSADEWSEAREQLMIAAFGPKWRKEVEKFAAGG